MKYYLKTVYNLFFRVFCFKSIDFCSINKYENVAFIILCRFNTNLFRGFLKLIGYFASVVNVVLSNPCVGRSRRIKYLYFCH